MAKKWYIGVADKARKVKKAYVGVDGIARKVKKGYVGVNGVARQFFASGNTVTITGTGQKSQGLAQAYVEINGITYTEGEVALSLKDGDRIYCYTAAEQGQSGGGVHVNGSSRGVSYNYYIVEGVDVEIKLELKTKASGSLRVLAGYIYITEL